MTEDDTLTAADGYGTFAIAFPHQGQVWKFFFFFRLILIWNLYL